jgi:hypothetical protein
VRKLGSGSATTQGARQTSTGTESGRGTGTTRQKARSTGPSSPVPLPVSVPESVFLSSPIEAAERPGCSVLAGYRNCVGGAGCAASIGTLPRGDVTHHAHKKETGRRITRRPWGTCTCGKGGGGVLDPRAFPGRQGEVSVDANRRPVAGLVLRRRPVGRRRGKLKHPPCQSLGPPHLRPQGATARRPRTQAFEPDPLADPQLLRRGRGTRCGYRSSRLPAKVTRRGKDLSGSSGLFRLSGLRTGIPLDRQPET